MEQESNQKPVIWLAGDSTMQSYSEQKRPQWGWGEKLLELLEETVESHIIISHRDDSPFEQQRRYEGKKYIVDNCAMAGRSSKTFREEGRLQDIGNHIGQGDFLVIQFGHNDAGAGKPERYVPLESFRDSLQNFVEVAFSHGATPIFISSIVLCPGVQTDMGEAGEIKRLLPDYGRVMAEYAGELKIPYVDMNKLTGDYIQDMSREQAEELYLPDHVHLVEKGAQVYARLAVEELKRFIAIV